jgi:hypothetical protein
MVDLLESAERCRVKASHCERLAKSTAASLFANCCRELAQLLVLIADNEKDFVRSDLPAKQRVQDHLIAELKSRYAKDPAVDRRFGKPGRLMGPSPHPAKHAFVFYWIRYLAGRLLFRKRITYGGKSGVCASRHRAFVTISAVARLSIGGN